MPTAWLGPLAKPRNVEMIAVGLFAFGLVQRFSDLGASAFTLRKGQVVDNLVATYFPLIFVIVIGGKVLSNK